MLAADAQVARSILLYQNDLDKIKQLDDTKLMAMAGPQVRRRCSVITSSLVHPFESLMRLAQAPQCGSLWTLKPVAAFAAFVRCVVVDLLPPEQCEFLMLQS